MLILTQVYTLTTNVNLLFNVTTRANMLSLEFLRAHDLPITTDKILSTAMDCFFQHGYDISNISMVSRYAGISRVTIHKQFKSKEILFRAVVEKHFQQHNILISNYSKSEINFWQETQALIIQRCEGFFNDVSSSLVRANLLHAGQAYCKDLIQAEEGLCKNSIRSRIEKEISANRLTLNKIGLSADELAETVHFAPFGITVSVSDQNNIAFVENLMAVFKASTSPH
jgi:AcrR family transcriptional regulator